MLDALFGTFLNAVALLLMVAFLALIVAVKTLPFMLVIYLGLALAKIKNKKKPLLFSFLTIFAILFMANLELYFAPYPMIDTVLAEKFSI